MQVSRLGNPLFNEVIVPLGDKDRWNATDPVNDSSFAEYVKQPELARLLNSPLPERVPEPREPDGGPGPTCTRSC